MRVTDPEVDVKAVNYTRQRLYRTILGGLVIVGCVVVALLHPEYTKTCFAVGLVGAGLVEPTQIAPFLTLKG